MPKYTTPPADTSPEAMERSLMREALIGDPAVAGQRTRDLGPAPATELRPVVVTARKLVTRRNDPPLSTRRPGDTKLHQKNGGYLKGR